MRAAGIPVQGLPAEHVGGQPIQAPQSDVLVQANPNFANDFNNLVNQAHNGGGAFHSSAGSGASNVPLPEAKPGENGLIGLLSSSIRKLVKDTGMADALSQGIPSVLGTGTTNTDSKPGVSHSTDTESSFAERSAAIASQTNRGGVRRQQSAAERALSGFASALGGGGNGPAHAGLPRIPGIPLLPGGIPRNSQGQIDVVNLIGKIY